MSLAATRFDVHGRPLIDGWLSISSFGIISARVTFLLDTGASGVMLMPREGVTINIPYSKIQFGGVSQGIGGAISSHSEKAEISFSDGHYQYAYDIDVEIVQQNQRIRRNPSLLGRRVLNHWKITYDAFKRILDVDPVYYNRKTP